jgi:hypothetical protein
VSPGLSESPDCETKHAVESANANGVASIYASPPALFQSFCPPLEIALSSWFTPSWATAGDRHSPGQRSTDQAFVMTLGWPCERSGAVVAEAARQNSPNRLLDRGLRSAHRPKCMSGSNVAIHERTILKASTESWRPIALEGEFCSRGFDF